MPRSLAVFFLAALLGFPGAAAAAPGKLKFSFRLELNEQALERKARAIPFNEASEFRAKNKQGGSRLFLEVLPTKRADDSVLLTFAVGEIIEGRKVVHGNPRMILLNNEPAKLEMREEKAAAGLVLAARAQY